MKRLVTKKLLSGILALSVVAVLATGCAKPASSVGGAANNATPAPAQTEEVKETEAPAETEPAKEEATQEAEAPKTEAAAANTLKTGIGTVGSIAKSKDVGDNDGLGQGDIIVAAVTVTEDGKLDNVLIDSVQGKVNFDATGKITTDIKAEVPSKTELGDAYGMKKASPIGKEWYEQIAVFMDYVKGKTADEIKGIANEEGKAKDADLIAGCTINITDYIEAVTKGMANAQDLGAKAGDKLGIGVSTNVAKSKDAAADKEGLVQVYCTYIASTYSADGKISSAVIDAMQANVNFDTAGKVTSDLAKAPQTKNELGDAYGMRKASAIGKEWNEQAAAYAKYITGKSVDEVKAIAVDETTKTTEPDLASSVTISTGEFVSIVEKSAATAK